MQILFTLRETENLFPNYLKKSALFDFYYTEGLLSLRPPKGEHCRERVEALPLKMHLISSFFLFSQTNLAHLLKRVRQLASNDCWQNKYRRWNNAVGGGTLKNDDSQLGWRPRYRFGWNEEDKCSISGASHNQGLHPFLWNKDFAFQSVSSFVFE